MINTNATSLKLLDASVTSGESSDVLANGAYTQTAIQVVGAVAVGLYVSNNGADFAKFGADLAGNSWQRIDGYFPFLKVTRAASTTEVTVLVNRTTRPQDY